MTITGSYPQTGYQDQQAYLDQVAQTFKGIEAATSVVSVHSATAPTQEVIKAQWFNQVPYLPPSNGGHVNWFNPNTGKIEQVYYPVVGGLSDLYPYKPKPTNNGMVFITESVVGAASAFSISSIPTTSKHLLIQFSVRASGAGDANEVIGIRINGVSTAIYSYLGYAVLSAANPTILTGTGLTQGQVGVCPQGGVTDNNQAAVGNIWIPNYSSVVSANQRWMIATCSLFANNARPYTKRIDRTIVNFGGTGGVTSLSLFPVTATTFQRGSKIVIWGLE